MRVVSLYVLLASVCLQATPAELLINGGFEDGDLTGWEKLAGGSQGVVVMGSANNGANGIKPNGPRSGDYQFSSSDVDAPGGAGEITIGQTIDLSGFGYVGSGQGYLIARGFFAGAVGQTQPSNDTAQIVMEFYSGGLAGSLIGTQATQKLDPVVGEYNLLELFLVPVPAATDTLRFKVVTELDPGFNSIDITADDLSLCLTPTPGDTDVDGDVDDADLGTLFANFTGPIGAAGAKAAADGDGDCDGDVDDADLANAFAGFTGPLVPTNVPEPASLTLLAVAGMLVARRRR